MPFCSQTAHFRDFQYKHRFLAENCDASKSSGKIWNLVCVFFHMSFFAENCGTLKPAANLAIAPLVYKCGVKPSDVYWS